MNSGVLFNLTGVILFIIGLYGFIARPRLLQKILSFNIMGSGVFLLLISVAFSDSGPDPVPHALVLTGIVVTVAVTAFALAILRIIHSKTGWDRLPEGNDE